MKSLLLSSILVPWLVAAAGDPGLAGHRDVELLHVAAPRLDVPVFLPASGEPAPVVLIVHGFGGWGVGSNLGPLRSPATPGVHTRLARHLASRGFAAALFHQSSPVEMKLDRWRERAKATLDALESAPALRGRLATKEGRIRVALAGHSYGGATSISLSDDPRVEATVAFAPGVASPTLVAGMAAGLLPGSARGRFEKQLERLPLAGEARGFIEDHASRPRCPVLVIRPERVVQDQSRRAFSKIESPKLYLELKGGVHSNFAEFDVAGVREFRWPGALEGLVQREVAVRWTTAWIEHHMKRGEHPRFVSGEAALDDARFSLVERANMPGLADGVVRKIEPD